MLKLLKITKSEKLKTKHSKRKISKKIPNREKLDFNWNIENFKRHFNAGFSGPLKANGESFFLLKKKKKGYSKLHLSKKKNLKNFRIKNQKDEFIIKLRNNFIKVDTDD